MHRDSPRAWLRQIISGGQTGADRAALDVAIELGIDHGGWVPRGRWAEDGPLPERYRVRETPTDEVAVRTAWNVRDSDATLIVSHGPLTSGSALTWEVAQRCGKPVLHLDLNRLDETTSLERLREWLAVVRPAVLNVAGPRASTDPAIYARVRDLLRRLLAPPPG
jgi:hypothetical protein